MKELIQKCNESNPIDTGQLQHTTLGMLLSRQPIPVAARPKAWVCGPSLAGIAGSNPWGHRRLSLVSVVCSKVEVSESV